MITATTTGYSEWEDKYPENQLQVSLTVNLQIGIKEKKNLLKLSLLLLVDNNNTGSKRQPRGIHQEKTEASLIARYCSSQACRRS
jgi:hypothetical protein